ncbi:MAG: BON domain-containing protein [Tatlockia sp.]|nr:BON domain-containing protein [Tatlockia sp.]
MRRFLILLINLILLMSFKFAYADNNLQEIEQNISDSVITTKITAKLTQNPDLNLLQLSISTTNGIVTLKGHVKNNQAFVDTLKVAKFTEGVKAVNANDLVIKQVNTALADAYITAKVEAAVLVAKVFDDESIPLVGINASTSNGTVTLSGAVREDKSIEAIIKRVNAIRGVKKIVSNLQVNKDVT